MPAKKPMRTTSSRANHSVNVQDMSTTMTPAPTMATPKMPLAGQVVRHARAQRDAQAQADEDGAEQQAVGGLAAPERVRVRLTGRDDHAGRHEGTGDADDQPADQRGVAGEGEAVPQRAEEALLLAVPRRRPAGR